MAGPMRTTGIASTRILALGVVVVAGCAACSKAGREAPSPPPIAASKPAATPPVDVTAEERPSGTPPAAPPPAGAQEPAPATTAPTAAPAAVAPSSAHDTSLPGAIPPSPLPPGVEPPTGNAEDPLKWLQESEARKADHARRLREAESAVDAGRIGVSTWEKAVLAFKNPLLPRPVLAPEDAQAVGGMGGAERVKWAEDRLAAERAALASALNTLEGLKQNPPLN